MSDWGDVVAILRGPHACGELEESRRGGTQRVACGAILVVAVVAVRVGHVRSSDSAVFEFGDLAVRQVSTGRGGWPRGRPLRLRYAFRFPTRLGNGSEGDAFSLGGQGAVVAEGRGLSAWGAPAKPQGERRNRITWNIAERLEL